MELRDIDEQQATEFFINDPALAYMGLSDNCMNELYYNKKYIFSPNSRYMGVFNEENMVGLFKYEAFSEVAIVGHMYVAYSFQKKGNNPAIWKTVHDYLVKNTEILKVITAVPEPCTHVQKAGEKIGFVLEGTIKKACVWRKEIVDLLFYSNDLNREGV